MIFNAIELKFFNVSCCSNCITTDYYACISSEIRKHSLLDVILIFVQCKCYTGNNAVTHMQVAATIDKK